MRLRSLSERDAIPASQSTIIRAAPAPRRNVDQSSGNICIWPPGWGRPWIRPHQPVLPGLIAAGHDRRQRRMHPRATPRLVGGRAVASFSHRRLRTDEPKPVMLENTPHGKPISRKRPLPIAGALAVPPLIPARSPSRAAATALVRHLEALDCVASMPEISRPAKSLMRTGQRRRRCASACARTAARSIGRSGSV